MRCSGSEKLELNGNYGSAPTFVSGGATIISGDKLPDVENRSPSRVG